MSQDPIRYETPPDLETVVVEHWRTPEGQDLFNVKGMDIQHRGQIWEKMIFILQGGLRATIVQTALQQAQEPSRIVAPGGFLLPPSAGH